MFPEPLPVTLGFLVIPSAGRERVRLSVLGFLTSVTIIILIRKLINSI